MIVYPIVEDNGIWNVSNDVLYATWKAIVAEGKDKLLFYDGSVTSPEGFVRFVKAPGNFPLFVVEEESGNIHMLAWLNGLMNGTAQSHFCSVGKYRRGAAEKIIEYWMSLEHEGKKIIHALIGITPEPLKAAVKLAKLAGYTVLGTIPNFCNMVYEARRVPGVISYYARGGNGDGR